MTHSPLFLYGTLRDQQIRDAALGRVVKVSDLTPGLAIDHRAVYFPGEVYPALVRRAGASAPGLLLRGMTQADYAALDRFEGGQYRRGPLQVMTDAGAVAAEAYWSTIAIAETEPAWTLEHWVAAHRPAVLDREIALAHAARR